MFRAEYAPCPKGPALAARPESLIATPDLPPEPVAALLATALRRVRITDSMQYCYMPSGDWETDATPAAWKPHDAVSFHILAEGTCWLEMGGQRRTLRAGDIAAFPFGTPHRIGAGAGGPEIDPGGALPPGPWRETPVLRFGGGERVVRILCGYVRCEALSFGPFRAALPELVLVATAGGDDWLAPIVARIVAEVDAPQGGGTAILERLTELALIEVLRRQLLAEPRGTTGWLSAIRDPVVGRCLGLMHADPARPWTVALLTREAGASRSVIAARFAARLGRTPMSYLRDWRLLLARERLARADVSIGALAEESGYGSEAAFCRAFARATGCPPGAYRARMAG